MALTVWTYDRVPEGPRGFVRDLRLRWALEEARFNFSVRSTPFEPRGPEHLNCQPFGQVPFLTDITIFESGACLKLFARLGPGRLSAKVGSFKDASKCAGATFSWITSNSEEINPLIC
jgi:glutathione S-transferase